MAPEPVAFTDPVRFGNDLELDPRAYELRRAGRPLKLERIPMELLLLLVERRGQLVAREQIIDRIWGKDVFLDADSSINSAIRKIRHVLKDDPEQPRFLQTVTGRGYRFIAPVAESSPPSNMEGVAEPPSAAREYPVGKSIAREARSGPRKLWVSGFLAVGLLLLLGWAVGIRRQRFPRSGSAPIRSIAVLPLENLTGDPGQQYFTDGMTDALITTLAQVGSLRVISRTSSMHYRDSSKALPEIARELGVDAVVEGSVARSGNRVRIDAQLIQAPTDRHLWAKSYERDIQDVLALQGELARTIASEVQIQLTPKEQERLGNTAAVKPEAYEAYLKGRFFWNKRSKEAIDKSIEYFNEAIRLDPGYAAAYSGLADAYNSTGCGRAAGIAIAEAGPRAKAAALRAVELDDKSAEAHAALGHQKECYEGDRLAAENEYRRAIALNPNYATAHHWYAHLLLGWHDQEGLDQIQQALRLDPVSPNINGMLGDYLMETRQFEKGVEQLRKTAELDPQQYNSRIRLGFAYAIVHRYAEAEDEFKKAEEASPGSVNSLGGLAYVYGLEGRKAEAEKMLPQVKAQAVSAGHPWVIGLVCIGLDRKDEAIGWLEKAYEQRDPYLDLENPLVDCLRSDARFQDLERRMKIERQVQALK
jgi:TolB-like protein/DNA-binding winged helix-turn-helix (wHTH) protein/Tfp pilus assembly protein PilF